MLAVFWLATEALMYALVDRYHVKTSGSSTVSRLRALKIVHEVIFLFNSHADPP
jgi:hypothetical protein